MDIYSSITDTVGNTPLLRLGRIDDGLEATLAVKLEYFSPGGSIKDRAALSMITRAEQDGSLQPGATIVEATSGNTGCAIAMIAAARGYRTVIVCTDTIASEKTRILRAFGAEVLLVPADAAPDSPEHYLQTARRVADETGGVFANQSFNPANPEAHYRSTGPEIWQQTRGRVTTFVAGAGTGGTISGTGRYLKEQNPSVEVVLADPVGSVYGAWVAHGQMAEPTPYLVEATGQNEPYIPESFDAGVIDRVVEVDDRTSFEMARRLAAEEGVFCGMSSGLIVSAALQVAREKEAGDVVVAIVCDAGDKYLSRLYDDDWLEAHLDGKDDHVS